MDKGAQLLRLPWSAPPGPLAPLSPAAYHERRFHDFFIKRYFHLNLHMQGGAHFDSCIQYPFKGYFGYLSLKTTTLKDIDWRSSTHVNCGYES